MTIKDFNTKFENENGTLFKVLRKIKGMDPALLSDNPLTDWNPWAYEFEAQPAGA